MAIQTNRTGFNNVSYTLTALPIIPVLKLQGFASDGVSWDDVEVSTVEKGADGLAYINDKPVVYSGTFTLQANSASREELDNLLNITAVKYGKKIVDYVLVLTEENYTTGIRTIYSDGTITSAKAGNDASLDGQGNKTYTMSFGEKVSMPL